MELAEIEELIKMAVKYKLNQLIVDTVTITPSSQAFTSEGEFQPKVPELTEEEILMYGTER